MFALFLLFSLLLSLLFVAVFVVCYIFFFIAALFHKKNVCVKKITTIFKSRRRVCVLLFAFIVFYLVFVFYFFFVFFSQRFRFGMFVFFV